MDYEATEEGSGVRGQGSGIRDKETLLWTDSFKVKDEMIDKSNDKWGCFMGAEDHP